MLRKIRDGLEEMGVHVVRVVGYESAKEVRVCAFAPDGCSVEMALAPDLAVSNDQITHAANTLLYSGAG